MKDLIYRHYGNKELNDISPVTYEDYWNKPIGGLWASPDDDENYHTWKNYNEGERVRECDIDNSFIFKLVDKPNILSITKPEDLVSDPTLLISNTLISRSRNYLNIPYIIEHYNGIELIHGEFYGLFHLDLGYHEDKYNIGSMFYSWDCDSICIWNADIIEIIKEDK